MQTKFNAKPRMVVEAKVIRKNGTVEDLGVISDSSWGILKRFFKSMKRRLKNG